MDKKEEAFKKKLLATFNVEADDHLKAISSGLTELEETDDQASRLQLTENIYREVHSLKGASRAVDQRDIETICNALENLFGKWKHGTFKPSAGLYDNLHRIVDFMSEIVSAPRTGDTILNDDISEILGQLDGPAAEPNGAKEKDKSISPEAPGKKQDEKEHIELPRLKTAHPAEKEYQPVHKRHEPADTVRISRTKLDTLMMQSEEMLSAKLKLFQRLTDLRDAQSVLHQLDREYTNLIRENGSIRDFTGNKDNLRDQKRDKKISGQFQGYEKIRKSVILLENKFNVLIKSAENDQRMTGRMIDNLLVEMRNVLMFPFSSILESFPRLVRDLSREQQKNVELVIRGAENEVDRRILEEIKDPLIHLVRNCIDHGIEKPEERIKNKKPPYGTINISVDQLPENKIEILISDDGAGIDLRKVKESAVKEKIISEGDAMTDQEAEALIFYSGITTSSFITDISGRGLGLAIVREKVDSLDGTLSVKSEPDKGTTFRIQIPVTLATYRGIFFQVSDALFAIPTRNIEMILKIYPDEIKMVENKQTITHNGNTLSYVYMGDILELKRNHMVSKDLPGSNQNQNTVHVLISGKGDGKIAFGVDRILNEQEILVKHLSTPLSRVRNVGGVTVLGSGRVVPILNVSDMLKSAVSGTVAAERTSGADKEEAKQKYVMVAEDSITSRMLLKDILESAGFNVKTAVDGAEALSFLREGGYDLLVSDIDMPRLNGFELTEKIRGDKTLKDLPIVLVTALQTREDRERGMEAGANAYIEKSTFTPQNLLDAVGRLV
jgi:two-component system chemotaxis sensor kinase CheA